jgi:NAD-dependent SIR2 family protein deacetylase
MHADTSDSDRSGPDILVREALVRFVRRHPRLFVLSGAGISTASGIPDYRDEEGRWKRKSPVEMSEFLASDAARRRYWARSMAGWPAVARARPNAAHAALARLQAAGYVHGLVTQNVDGLHQRAGSRQVIELHGSVDRVVCLDCGGMLARRVVQDWLEAANPSFADAAAVAAGAPDGDADLEPAGLDAFRLPECEACGGTLKPDVVFFGDTVPKPRVEQAMAALASADAVLVLGSSLMLYSGYRFCAAAHRGGKPIAAINLGRTRADPLLQLKLESPCAQALGNLTGSLLPLA